MPNQSVPLSFPFKGLNESQALVNQPSGTTPRCQNVYGYDPASGRNRGASRCGMSRYTTARLGTTAVQDIDHVVGIVEPGSVITEDSDQMVMEDGNTLMDMETASSSNVGQRQTTIIGVCGGAVKTITSTAATTVTNGSTALSSQPNVIFSTPFSSTDTLTGNSGFDLFFADGTNYKYLDVSANAMVTWTASAGTLPADGSGNKATLIEQWHNRVVLSGVIGDPQNWYMSAVDNAFDFDYSPTTLSETMAVAGNQGNAGKMGDIITALIPYSDDTLLLGGANSLERMSGDPAAGGRRDLISDITGVAWGRAWAKAPDGTVYFMGSRGGVYRIQPQAPTAYGGIPQRLTAGVIDERLADIQLDDNLVTLEWDDRAIGVRVYITPKNGTSTTHYFYDMRNEAWWPVVYQNSYHNPLCCHLMSGYAKGDRRILLGTQNGYILQIDEDAASDDGTAIESNVFIGPLPNAMILELQATFGTQSGNVKWSIHTAEDQETALDANPIETGRFIRGRNPSQWPRKHIDAGYLQLSSTDRWSLEKLAATIEQVSESWARQL